MLNLNVTMCTVLGTKCGAKWHHLPPSSYSSPARFFSNQWWSHCARVSFVSSMIPRPVFLPFSLMLVLFGSPCRKPWRYSALFPVNLPALPLVGSGRPACQPACLVACLADPPPCPPASLYQSGLRACLPPLHHQEMNLFNSQALSPVSVFGITKTQP